ncbi:MAG TPA: trigger factor [Nitrospiraceae bacterium]|nr:trigger factor [Nitrospiraceae bacterium]
MKTAVEDLSAVKKKIRIDVPLEDLTKETNKALADIGKKAKIAGFRQGKAPRDLVERHYGEQVQGDVINKLITRSYFAAVRENNLDPVVVPEFTDIQFAKGQPLTFTATVEVRPTIELGTYDGIEVKEADVAATDPEVDQTIDRLREMYAQLEVVEGRAVDGSDTVVIDFEGFHDGKPIEGAKAADHMLPLGKGSLIPGFEEQIVGMNKGETKEIQVTFPGDYANKEIAGKDATFTVALKEIKKQVLPELNDEFAKDIGDHQTLEELRVRIKEDVEVRKGREQESAQREELLSKIVEAHSFEIPASMVEEELKAMIRQQAQRMARQGAPAESIDEAKFREEGHGLAEKRVKGMLILDEIAEKEKVTVSDQELAAGLAGIARNAGQPVEAIKKYYANVEGGMENLRASLLQEKTLNHLLSRAKKVYN